VPRSVHTQLHVEKSVLQLRSRAGDVLAVRAAGGTRERQRKNRSRGSGDDRVPFTRLFTRWSWRTHTQSRSTHTLAACVKNTFGHLLLMTKPKLEPPGVAGKEKVATIFESHQRQNRVRTAGAFDPCRAYRQPCKQAFWQSASLHHLRLVLMMLLERATTLPTWWCGEGPCAGSRHHWLRRLRKPACCG
jgi:hypothetical protein